MGEIGCYVTGYRENIVRCLYELQQRNSLCDVEIFTAGGIIHVHKLILAVSESPVLHESVNIVDKVSSFGKTKINFSDYPLDVVNALVRYLYTGEIKILEKSSTDFSKLCQSLKLDNAVDVLINQKIQQNIVNCTKQDGCLPSDSVETCGKWSFSSETVHDDNSQKTLVNKADKCLSIKTCQKEKVTKTGKNDSDVSNKETDMPVTCDFNDDDNDDTQDLDLREYSTAIKNKSSSQHAIIKVGITNQSCDPNSESYSNSNENNTVNMFLMSPEHNPYFETPEILKKPKPRTKKSIVKSKNIVRKLRSKNKKRIQKLKIVIRNKHSELVDTIDDVKQKQDEVQTENDAVEKSDDKKTKRRRGIIHRWCRKCNVRLEEKDLRRHMREIHPPYACKLCDWTGLIKRELALHMYSKHQLLIMPDKFPLLQCDHQGCTFKTLISYALDRHKECHNRLVRHLCDVCGSSFATAGGLKEHSLRHAAENPIYKCQICDAVFGWKCKLKSHEMKEHGTYLLCEFCSYKTKYKDKLTMHLHRSHGQPFPPNQKIHRCDRCDFYCINRSSLRTHQLKHSGEKKFTCPQCGKSFLNQHQMKNHNKSTHGARTFGCHLCSYVSKRKSELNNHIKSRHSDDRPFTCNFCDYSCKLRGNLHKHIRLVHKVEVVTRNQLHQNMLETGKGYTQLLDARRTDNILIQEKTDNTTNSDILQYSESAVVPRYNDTNLTSEQYPHSSDKNITVVTNIETLSTTVPNYHGTGN